MRFVPFVCVFSISLAAPLMALDYPGCEENPAVRRALHEVDLRLSQKVAQLDWKELTALWDRAYDEVTAKYPRELRTHLHRIGDPKWDEPARREATRKHYLEMAAAHPADALALSLASRVLFESDTPESIRLAEAARAKAPDFWYPALLLAQEYAVGLHADKEKFTQNLRAYFALCPASANQDAMRLLPKLADPALQANIARAMRARLSTETDFYRLADYEVLWGFEFRAALPANYDAVRKQIAEDVKRLESLNPKPEAEYLGILSVGYRQSGAPESRERTRSRILREAPNSQFAYLVVRSRWMDENKQPEDQSDVDAWAAYNTRYLEALVKWERQFASTQSSVVANILRERLRLLFADPNRTENECIAALEAMLAFDRRAFPASSELLARHADLLVRRKWRPELALQLLTEARAALPKLERQQIGSDNLTPEDRKEASEPVIAVRNSIAQSTAKAALLLGKPEAAQVARAQLGSPLVEQDSKPDERVAHWRNLALLALLDKHPIDALTYYQVALQTRPEDPRMLHGQLDDPLMDEAKDLFKQMGGSETAFAHWSAKPAAALAEGRWEKPKTELAPFELTDTSGKTWKLKTFEGKTLLINLWTTWCEPCKAEMPEFQKLYDQVKGRADVQVVSFNLDDEPARVSPFLKDKGYTFPVLFAHDFVSGLLNDYTIPQNWLVNRDGKWLSTQLGYGGEADWVTRMLQRLESAK